MKIVCPYCKKQIDRGDAKMGHRIRCDDCGRTFFIRPSTIKSNRGNGNGCYVPQKDGTKIRVKPFVLRTYNDSQLENGEPQVSQILGVVKRVVHRAANFITDRLEFKVVSKFHWYCRKVGDEFREFLVEAASRRFVRNEFRGRQNNGRSLSCASLTQRRDAASPMLVILNFATIPFHFMKTRVFAYGAISVCSLIMVIWVFVEIDAKHKENTRAKVESKATTKRQFVEADAPTNSFKYASDKLAVVECKASSGSAFIVKLGNQKYLMTNEHVFRGGKGEKPLIRLLNGKQFEYSDVEVSEDRDLIRIRVDNSQKAFELEENLPGMGSPVKVFGNSEGGGVATELAGVVLGVGPVKLEIDAKIVRGNSGSPVVNGFGKVVGVATLITRDSDKKDWTKKDTRFNEVRRYALRMAEIKWRHYAWAEYADQVEKSSDINSFCRSLYPFLLAFYNQVHPSYLTYCDAQGSDYRRNDGGFHAQMLDVAKEYEALDEVYTGWMNVEKGREKFIQQLREAVGPTDRAAYVDVYDFNVQVQQAKVIERLYDFNDAKLGAIRHLMKKIDEWQISIPQIVSGTDAEGGLEKTKECLGAFEKEIRNRLKNGNVKEIAIDMLTGRNDTKLNSGLGTILLFDWAKEGDDEAQEVFVRMWEDGKLNEEAVSLGECWKIAKPWFYRAYQSGDMRAAYVLGLLAYAEKQFVVALNRWKEAAKAGSAEAWVRIGRFYSQPQGDGGAPFDMRNENLAKDAFQKAKESGDERAEIAGQESLGRIYLNSENSNDWVLAQKEFCSLIDKKPSEGIYVFYCGMAQLRIVTKAWENRSRIDYAERQSLLVAWEEAVMKIEKAVRMGVEGAKEIAVSERRELEESKRQEIEFRKRLQY